MVTKNGVLTLLFLGIFSAQILESEAQFEDALKTFIGNQLNKLWDQGSREFLGHQCDYRVTPKIRKWQLKFDARFWCTGFAPFSGNGFSSSSGGSVRSAIIDFSKKAVDHKLVDRKELELWLSEHKRR